MIEKNEFREDLYHRLAVITIQVPSLRERIEDIPLLIDYFNQLISSEYGSKPKSFEKEAIQTLQSLPWTGNIRELRNVVERLLILGGDKITAEDVKKYVTFV